MNWIKRQANDSIWKRWWPACTWRMAICSSNWPRRRNRAGAPCKRCSTSSSSRVRPSAPVCRSVRNCSSSHRAISSRRSGVTRGTTADLCRSSVLSWRMTVNAPKTTRASTRKRSTLMVKCSSTSAKTFACVARPEQVTIWSTLLKFEWRLNAKTDLFWMFTIRSDSRTWKWRHVFVIVGLLRREPLDPPFHSNRIASTHRRRHRFLDTSPLRRVVRLQEFVPRNIQNHPSEPMSSLDAGCSTEIHWNWQTCSWIWYWTYLTSYLTFHLWVGPCFKRTKTKKLPRQLYRANHLDEDWCKSLQPRLWRISNGWYWKCHFIFRFSNAAASRQNDQRSTFSGFPFLVF